MPCYHLTIKLDRRPDGMAINPETHAEYISREGKFKDIDDKREQTANLGSSEDVQAQAHAEYINREAAFRQKGGCIFKAHHLPSWAQDSPSKFFEAADQHEDPNNIRYREIEFALPNELTLEQNKEIITEFIEHHLKDFYYAAAVHDKDAAMENDQRNMHVHIMFSERKLDEIEYTNERPPELFFKKANWRDLTRGGAKKDPKWNGTNRAKYLFEIRKDFALIQNKTLEKYGHDVRVDHRTLEAQREDALRRGDTVLANILDRIPERHLGPEITSNVNHPDVIELKKYRHLKAEHQKLIHAVEFLEKSIENEKLLISSQENNQEAEKVLSEAEKNSCEFNLTENIEMFHAYKIAITDLSKELIAVQSSLISHETAINIARKQFMMPEERKIALQLKLVHQDLMAAEKLEQHLKKTPPESNQAALQKYSNLRKDLTARIEYCISEKNHLAKEYANVNKRLSTPEMKGKIMKTINKILRDNQPAKDRLEDINKELYTTTTQMQNIILSHMACNEPLPGTMKKLPADKVKEILSASLHSIRIEKNNLTKEISFLSNKYISEERAVTMAKNVFTKGRYKTLRESFRSLDKEKSRIHAIKEAHSEAMYKLSSTPKPKWWQNHDEYQATQQEVQKLDLLLTSKNTEWQKQAAALKKESLELEQICSSIDAQKKIINIVNGILRKNKPIADKLSDSKTKVADLQKKETELGGLQKGVYKQIAADKNKNVSYQVRTHSLGGGGGSGTDKSIPNPIKLIALALNQNPAAVSLVARLADDHEIDWSGLNELDRKVAIAKLERE